MSETEATSVRGKRSSTKSATGGDTTLDDALEQGYVGGPVDDTDYTAGADRPAVSDRSATHDDAPAKAAELQQAVRGIV
jgi:hypothetical protein